MISRARDSSGATSTNSSSSSLPAASAIELASALVQHVAHSAGVRILTIKGPTLHHHGLRPVQESGDVDVLVEPGQVPRLASALEQRGWHPRSAAFGGQTDAPHAHTLIHSNWPCDLDLHAYFPGLLAPPAVAFEALWDHREELEQAHVSCAIPDLPASTLIMIANDQRLPTAERDVASRRIEPSDIQSVVELAERTGCVLALRVLGVDRPLSTAELLAAGAGSHGRRLALIALAEARGSVRLKVAGSLTRPSVMRRALRRSGG